MAQHPTPDRVEVLGLDMIGTITEWRESREVITARFLKRHRRILTDVDEIARITTELRRRFPRGDMDMDTYWVEVINFRLFRALGIRKRIRHLIRAFRRELFSNPENFIVRDDMRRFIETLVRDQRVNLIIMSNHDRVTIVRLLKAFDLYRYFRHEHIFTSKQIGHTKPSRAYFESIRQALGLRSLSQMALLGNSISNDGDAVDLWMPVCIIDRTKSLSRLEPSLKEGITPAWKTTQCYAWASDICQLGGPLPFEDDPSNGNALTSGRVSIKRAVGA